MFIGIPPARARPPVPDPLSGPEQFGVVCAPFVAQEVVIDQRLVEIRMRDDSRLAPVQALVAGLHPRMPGFLRVV